MERVLLILLVFIICSAGCVTTAEEWNQRGETHHTMGRYEEAVAAFDQALSLDPDYSEAWKNRGLSLALVGRTDESGESFVRAITLDPGDSEIFYYQALSRNSSGNRSAALESLDAAIALLVIDPIRRRGVAQASVRGDPVVRARALAGRLP